MGKSRSTGIDLLRGTLALWVLLTHLFLFSEVTTGAPELATDATHRLIDLFQGNDETHPAVLGFIVLSGYCIHRNGLRRDDDDLRAYGIRRSFRILPVYLLAIAVGIGCFLYADQADPELAPSLTGTSSISAGCVAAKVTGSAAFVPSQYTCSFEGNVPLVTVMAEIWLYVVYALAFVLLLRGVIDERLLWGGIALAWVAGVIWVSRHPGDFAWWHNGSVLGFLPFWWLGAKFTDPAFAARVRRLLPGVLLGWLALTVVLLRDATHSIFAIDARMLLLALIFGSLIVALDALVTERGERASRVGKAGYSIYAFHAPVIYALLIAGVPWWFVGILAIGTGLLVFHVYERPLWRLGHRIGTYRRPSGGLSAPRRAPARWAGRDPRQTADRAPAP